MKIRDVTELYNSQDVTVMWHGRGKRPNSEHTARGACNRRQGDKFPGPVQDLDTGGSFKKGSTFIRPPCARFSNQTRAAGTQGPGQGIPSDTQASFTEVSRLEHEFWGQYLGLAECYLCSFFELPPKRWTGLSPWARGPKGAKSAHSVGTDQTGSRLCWLYWRTEVLGPKPLGSSPITQPTQGSLFSAFWVHWSLDYLSEIYLPL